jgi:predicted membrane protein
MKITINIITAKAEKAQELGLTLTEEDTLGHRIRRAIAKPRRIQMKKFHERTIRILIFILMFFVGILFISYGTYNIKKKHNSTTEPVKAEISVPAKAEASTEILPKGYSIQRNKITGKYRWTNKNYHSTFPFNTKEEAIKFAVRDIVNEKEDAPENWETVETAK